MWLVILVFIFILLYLYHIAPNTDKQRKARMASFEHVYLAHRGLFNRKDIPENCLKGFILSTQKGYGCELDVQLTADNKLIVFHDGNLKRMCGVDKNVVDCTYAELQQYSLGQSKEKIPLFEDVLNVLKEDTPLVIEIKADGDGIATCKATVQMMKNYKRNFTIESFDPRIVKYLRVNHPEIIRGQLAYDMFSEPCNQSFFNKFICSNLWINIMSRPDYVAYDALAYKKLSFRLISRVFKGECVAWTIKNDEQFRQVRKYYQQFIFDSYIPNEDLENGH